MKKQIVCALAATMALTAAQETIVTPVDAKTKVTDKVVKKKKKVVKKKVVEKSYAQKFVDAYCSLQVLDEYGNFTGNAFVIEAVTEDNYEIVLAGMAEYEFLDEFTKEEINLILSSVTEYVTYDEMYEHALEIFEEIESEKETDKDDEVNKDEDLDDDTSNSETDDSNKEETLPEDKEDESDKNDVEDDKTSDKEDETSKDESNKDDLDKGDTTPEDKEDTSDKNDVEDDKTSNKEDEESKPEEDKKSETDVKEEEKSEAKEVEETVKPEESMPIIAMVEPVSETEPLLQTALETSVLNVENKVELVKPETTLKQEKKTTKKTTAQNFIDTHLTASTGSVYAQATTLNYKNILNSLSSWNKLTSTQRNDVNAILNKQIGKTYQTLLKEAQTIQFNGVPSSYTNNPTRRVNTATESHAGLYGALMGLSIALAGFIFKKRKEEN